MFDGIRAHISPALEDRKESSIHSGLALVWCSHAGQEGGRDAAIAARLHHITIPVSER